MLTFPQEQCHTTQKPPVLIKELSSLSSLSSKLKLLTTLRVWDIET